MQNYRKTSHSTYDLKYHIVWITKYRKQVMVGSGNVTDEVVMQYIQTQDIEAASTYNFKIGEVVK